YTRFCFEAKRLGKGNPVSRYLGVKGLGCFLSGSYAGAEQRGGMLGYVQSDDEQTWAAKIDKELVSSPKSFGLQTKRNHFPLYQINAQFHHTYVSEHRRITDGKRFQIYHSFLMFYGGRSRPAHDSESTRQGLGRLLAQHRRSNPQDQKRAGDCGRS